MYQEELLPILQQVERITLGERGERVVGGVLDELQSDGYAAIHSIHREGFDIDHVLVGPGGVFAIETKYRRGAGVITFRNEAGIFVGEQRRWNKAMEQAKNGANEVTRIVREDCGLSEAAWPVLIFVGNWQGADQWDTTDARVFTPESLKSYIRQQQPVLKRVEIERIAAAIG